MSKGRCNILWGADTPRVLMAAPRRNALRRKSSRWRGRHRQYARRVRSRDSLPTPNDSNAQHVIAALEPLRYC